MNSSERTKSLYSQVNNTANGDLLLVGRDGSVLVHQVMLLQCMPYISRLIQCFSCSPHEKRIMIIPATSLQDLSLGIKLLYLLGDTSLLDSIMGLSGIDNSGDLDKEKCVEDPPKYKSSHKEHILHQEIIEPVIEIHIKQEVEIETAEDSKHLVIELSPKKPVSGGALFDSGDDCWVDNLEEDQGVELREEEPMESFDAEMLPEEENTLNDKKEDGAEGDKCNTERITDQVIAKYNKVMAVVVKKQGKTFVSLAETPRDEIPNLLECFFKIIRTQKGELYNASSLNTYLGSFVRYLADNFDPPIDMKTDHKFLIVKTAVARMKKESRATQGKTPGENASRALAPEHLKMAWDNGHIGRENPDALHAATYLAFTMGLGCRAVREVYSVNNGILIMGPIGQDGVPEFIELDEQWVSQNRVAKDFRLLEARVNPDHENPDTCYVRTILEMQRRKTEPQCSPHVKFWLNVKESAREEPKSQEKWFKNNHMGKHALEKLLPNALTRAGLDCKAEKYNATSARKSMKRN